MVIVTRGHARATPSFCARLPIWVMYLMPDADLQWMSDPIDIYMKLYECIRDMLTPNTLSFWLDYTESSTHFKSATQKTRRRRGKEGEGGAA